jgi:serine/threonine protein kinase
MIRTVPRTARPRLAVPRRLPAPFDRYDIRQSLGKGGMGEVFLAFDRSTQQTVALKVVREESRMPGDDEALRQELLLARQVSHPNVCRVHDLAPEPVGAHPGDGAHPRPDAPHAHPQEEGPGRLHRRRVPQDRQRRSASGLAAIHAQGLVHGDLKPGNVMVTEEKAVILDFGFAQERARARGAQARRPARRRHAELHVPGAAASGGASADDDVYAMALTLWEMWTCRVPEPG